MRIESRPPAGPAGILYQDAAEVEKLKASMDKGPAAADAVGRPVAGTWGRIWGAPAFSVDALLSAPPLPAGRTAPPAVREQVDLLRSLVHGQAAAAPAGEAVGRLFETLAAFVKAQDAIQSRVAKLTKA